MPTMFTLTSPQWEDLGKRMYGEGVLHPALHRDNDTGAIGVSGQVEDMVLFLSHVAELIEDSDHSPVSAMERLRYFVDQVELRDHIWWLPCVRQSNTTSTRGTTDV